jgi:hypothetical protein
LCDGIGQLTPKKIPEWRIDGREGKPVLTGADEKVAPGKIWPFAHCPPFPTASQS